MPYYDGLLRAANQICYLSIYLSWSLFIFIFIMAKIKLEIDHIF